MPEDVHTCVTYNDEKMKNAKLYQNDSINMININKNINRNVCISKRKNSKKKKRKNSGVILLEENKKNIKLYLQY